MKGVKLVHSSAQEPAAKKYFLPRVITWKDRRTYSAVFCPSDSVFSIDSGAVSSTLGLFGIGGTWIGGVTASIFGLFWFSLGRAIDGGGVFTPVSYTHLTLPTNREV